MGNIVGADLREYVIKQINTRQFTHGSGIKSERTLEELSYLNSKTSWIKLASGVSVTADKLKEIGFDDSDAVLYQGEGLARKYILYNGTSEIASTNDDLNPNLLIETPSYSSTPSGYNPSVDYGIIPFSGITSLTVTSLNRGSLKKAKLTLTVQDRNQLSIIDTLYLRLGYTVLLEWGNSTFLSNQTGRLDQVRNTILESNLFFPTEDNPTKLKSSYSNILDVIDAKRNEYSANYDGMLGKISNFNWTFNEDGSYDIELTLISWGDVIESLKNNITADKNTIDFVADGNLNDQSVGIINTNRKENIIFSIFHAFKYINQNNQGSKGSTVNLNSDAVGNFVGSGSANGNIVINKSKIQYEKTIKLVEMYNGSEVEIANSQFVWMKTNYPQFEGVLPGIVQAELDYSLRSWSTQDNGAQDYSYKILPTLTRNSNISRNFKRFTFQRGLFRETANNKYDIAVWTLDGNDNELVLEPWKEFASPTNRVDSFPGAEDNTSSSPSDPNSYSPIKIYIPFSRDVSSVSRYYTLNEIKTMTNGIRSIGSIPLTPKGTKYYNNKPYATSPDRPVFTVNEITAFQTATKAPGWKDSDFKYIMISDLTRNPEKTTFFVWDFEGSNWWTKIRETPSADEKKFTNKSTIYSNSSKDAGLKELMKFFSPVQTDDFESQRQNNINTSNLLDTTPSRVWLYMGVKFPRYVWGIHTKPRNGAGEVITNTNEYSSAAYPPTFYWGCQNQIGADVFDRITSATTVLPLVDSTDGDLLDITGIITKILQDKIDAELKALQAVPPTYNPPKYNADTGMPEPGDKNYEFLSRFVGEGKPFNSKYTVKSKVTSLGSKTYKNPITDITFDPKGVFVLNTTPISQYYIKFSFFLSLLQSKVIYKIDEKDPIHENNTPIVSLNTSSADMLCIDSNSTGQMSYDLRVCAVRRDHFPIKDAAGTDKNLKVFESLDPWAYEDDNNSLKKDNANLANAMNIYLNFEFIGQCFESNTDEKGDVSIYKVLNSICSGVNKALGGINNLEPIIDENTNTLHIIDTSPKYHYEEKIEPYILKLYGYSPLATINDSVSAFYPNYVKTNSDYFESTFTRKITLKTAITPSYAAMVTIGSVAGGHVRGIEATAFAKWNKGILDRFKEGFIPAQKLLVNTPIPGSDNKETDVSINDSINSYFQAMLSSPFGFKITA